MICSFFLCIAHNSNTDTELSTDLCTFYFWLVPEPSLHHLCSQSRLHSCTSVWARKYGDEGNICPGEILMVLFAWNTYLEMMHLVTDLVLAPSISSMKANIHYNIKWTIYSHICNGMAMVQRDCTAPLHEPLTKVTHVDNEVTNCTIWKFFIVFCIWGLKWCDLSSAL